MKQELDILLYTKESLGPLKLTSEAYSSMYIAQKVQHEGTRTNPWKIRPLSKLFPIVEKTVVETKNIVNLAKTINY